MGVARNQYLMIGVKLPFNSELASKYDAHEDNGYQPEIKHVRGLAMVSDGMSGKYMFIGRILQKSGNNEVLDGPINFLGAIERYASESSKEITAQLISVLFDMPDITAVDIDIWFFTHYH